VIGSPHAGFGRPPVSLPAPLLGIWGHIDKTVPPLPNPDSPGHLGAIAPLTTIDTYWGGWRFESARETTRAWAKANGCERALGGDDTGGGPVLYAAAAEWPSFGDVNVSGAGGEDGALGSVCVTWGECANGAEVIECLHPGGHHAPRWREEALFSFISRHAAPAHRLPPARPLSSDTPGGMEQYSGGAGRPAGAAGAVLAALAAAALLGLLLCFWSARARRKRQGLLTSLSNRGIAPQPRSHTGGGLGQWIRASVSSGSSSRFTPSMGATRMVEIPGGGSAARAQSGSPERGRSGRASPQRMRTGAASDRVPGDGEDGFWAEGADEHTREYADHVSGRVPVSNGAPRNAGMGL
jgi:hypothetical protein